MAPKYTLIYFNGRGYGELSRLILAQAGVEYVDKRVEQAQWPALKKDMPFGHLPVLEVNGVQISESRAIARYLAKEHGLAGKTSLEASQADAIVDAIGDVVIAYGAIRREADADRKAALQKTFAEDTLPTFLTNLEAILKKNNSKFLVGDSLTWADIATGNLVALVTEFVPNAFDSHKTLSDHGHKVFDLPAIKDWINKRPKTDF